MKQRLYSLATLYVMSLSCVFLFQVAADDRLLFKSDLLNIIIFNAFLALPLFVIFSIAYFLLGLSSKIKPRLDTLTSTLTLCMLCSTLNIWAIDTYWKETLKSLHESDFFRASPILTNYLSPQTFERLDLMQVFIVLGVSFLLIYLFIRFAPHADSIKSRIQKLSAVTALLIFGVFIWHFGSITFSKKVQTAQAKHIIYIVIDGMPTTAIPVYNPEEKPTDFDSLVSKGMVYHKAYTNKTYTSGYFSALYTGQLNIKPIPKIPTIEKHLFNLMQNNNVKARYLVFHENGLPEITTADDYNGLRSYFLTERTSWIPELLGIDYHVFLDSKGTRLFNSNNRYQTVYKFLNPNASNFKEEKWATVIPQQIESLQETSHNSFLLIHVLFTTRGVQDFQDSSEVEVEEAKAYAKTTDYELTDEHEKALADINQSYNAQANSYGKNIKNLLDYLETSGRFANTTVIVTADHGNIAGKKRIWYGYHPHEEVTRVPLFVFQKGLKGESNDLVDSLDLGQTILSHFNINEKLNAKARSIFNPVEPKNINIFTLRSNLRKEHFVVIYDQNNKYLFNLHPEGDAKAVYGQVEGYEFMNIADIPESHEIWDGFKKALLEFDFRKDEVHERYKDFIPI